MVSDSEIKPIYSQTIDAALSLVEMFDKLRYHRIRSEISTIAFAHGFASSYEPVLKLCIIDLRHYYQKDNPRMVVILVACALIKEATNGYLLRRGIIRRSSNRERISSICIKETHRFMKKISNEFNDANHIRETPLSFIEKTVYTIETIKGAWNIDSKAEARIWESNGRYHPRDAKLSDLKNGVDSPTMQ